MTADMLILLVPAAAVLIPAVIAGRLTARRRRMRPAWWMALALFALSVGVFGVVTSDGWTDQEALPYVLFATVILAPAALGSILGGIVGRLFAR